MEEARFNNSNEGDKDSYSDNRFNSEEAIQQDIDQALMTDFDAKNNDGDNIFDVPLINHDSDMPQTDVQIDDGKGSEAAPTVSFAGSQQFIGQDE